MKQDNLTQPTTSHSFFGKSHRRRLHGLRKISKNILRKLIIKADRNLQDTWRKENPNGKCQVCGQKAYALHHFVPKSQSAILRYDRKNCVPICKSCHTKHHLRGDPMIHGTIIKKRGVKWFSYLERKRRETVLLDELFLRKQL